jgi:hypothetical protein
MQRSATQVLYHHLPGAVFTHEEGFIAKTHHVIGERASEINRSVILDELAAEIDRWTPDQVGIPNPRISPDEYIILEPKEISWDVYPLTFECTTCGRIRRWFDAKKVTEDTSAVEKIECVVCGSKMRQLRYLTAHNCGKLEPLYTPSCPNCGRIEDMRLEDLGSFRSSSWRCRTCGAARSTRFTPCDCGQYLPGTAGPAYQRGFTARDQRLWYPQCLTILNISGQIYDNLQRHPHRGIAALASWLGDETDLAKSLSELDRPGNGERMTQQQWQQLEQRLRAADVEPDIIEQMRAANGPAATGTAAILAAITNELAALANQRAIVERAGLFDQKIIDDRQSIGSLSASAPASVATSLSQASDAMTALGIDDISVTQRFPIVVASYGYSRVQQPPGSAHLRSYAQPRWYNGKTPIFAVPANAEALLITFDARTILSFLTSESNYSTAIPRSPRAARLALAELLATDPADTGPAGEVRRLVHSASHALLRALDDGQSGFGESSLAEWIVPDVLTTAIYVASYRDFTLGALETVLRRRVAPWIMKAADDVSCCDNDPMCSQTSPDRPHASCDRCLHLTFGCRTWNADLDRKLLRRFWLYTRRQTPAPVP